MTEPTSEFFQWVKDHAGDDPSRLRLKYGRLDGSIDYEAAITQVECRRKFGKKLCDTLSAFDDFYFPTLLSGEQSTSDLVATFHASLVAEGLPMADLTAGLGIDALHASARASSVVAVERDAGKADALRFNARGLKADNIEVVCGDCRDFVERCVAEGRRFATVFIDPARRSADGGRVFALAECEPDVTAMMPLLRRICDLLIIKASPMLDISHTVNALDPAPLSVMAVGTATECKELLIMVDFRRTATSAPTMIESVKLAPDGSVTTFAFTAGQEREAPQPPVVECLKEGDYILEPNPELMKTGAFRLVAARWHLSVFHPNTRLFASSSAVEGFPGMQYRVESVMPYASRNIKAFAGRYPVANVAVRNFGMSADALRARLRVRDGGPLRVYGITDGRGERLLVVCC